MKTSVKWTAALSGAAAMTAAAFEIRRELHTFRVKRYRFHNDKTERLKKNLKIVFLSDLHNKVYGKDNACLFQAVKAERPDLILVGGDMLVGKGAGVYRQGLEFVRQLPVLCPVFYANGNHEQRMKEHPESYTFSYEAYRRNLQKAGVFFLENETAVLPLHGLKLAVSGLELPMISYRKFRKVRVCAEDVSRCIGTCVRDDDSTFHILLAHNPAYGDAYMEWGADLVLCGHFHGGIVRIPGIGAPVTPQFHLFPQYSGEMTVKNGQAIAVSKGLGTHTVNVRLFNEAEIVSLTLEKGL